MNELRIPGRFSDFDTVWNFGNDVVEYIWHLEKRIAELERAMQIDPDEPVPYELCHRTDADLDRRVTEIIEAYIYLDAVQEDIWRRRRIINDIRIMTASDALLYTHVQREKQALFDELRTIFDNFIYRIETVAFNTTIYVTIEPYALSWVYDPGHASMAF